MKSIVEGTSVEESNKRVADRHMSRKTLVRKLDQLGYSRDEISAVTGHSNIKSLDSYLDTMNERKSTELFLAVSGISRKALQMQNPSSSISSATQLVAVQEDSAVNQRSMSTTTSQMCAVPSLLQAPQLPIHSCISFLPFICRLLEITSAARQQSTSHSMFSLHNDQKSLV